MGSKKFERIMSEKVGITLSDVEDRILRSDTATVGDWMSVMLVWRGMTYTELGKEIGCTKMTIANWVNDRQVPNLGNFVAMWMILTVGRNYTFEEIGNIYYHFANTPKRP